MTAGAATLDHGPADRRTRAGMTLVTRATLIAIARRHFGSLGYSGVSIEDITDEARLTRGALYHHFGSKSGLFRAVVDSIDGEIDALYQARLQDAGAVGSSSWQRLRIGSRCYLEAVKKPDVRQIIILDAPVHCANFADRSVTLNCRQNTVQALQSLIDDGHICGANATAVAYMIEGAMSWLINWSSDFDIGLEETLKQLDAFLDSLVARQAQVVATP